jgi:glycerol uptake facilitator-like aquaporin
MSAARLRKSATVKAGRQGGFENVEAVSRFELVPDTVTDKTMAERWIGFSGKHERPTWSQIFYALFMEFLGSWLIGVTVALAKWAAVGGSLLVNGALVGAAYGLAYYVGTRWVKDHVLRRHLNGAISMGYFLTNDIGLLGLLFYTIAQYAGGLLGGGMIAGLLKGALDLPPRSVVPLPTDPSSSLTTVLCLEFFGAAIIVFSLLLNEFMNTDETMRVKNFNRASKITAYTTFILVLISYQFGVFTFSNVAYFTGLFGGINAATPARDLINVAQLSNPALYPGSVFIGHGGAWALYLLGPYVGGIVGAALFWAIFALGVREKLFDGERYRRNAQPRLWPGPEMTAESPVDMTQAPIQTQLTDLVHPLMNGKR